MSHGMSEEIKRLHRLLDRKGSGADEPIITNEHVIAQLRDELEAFQASNDIRGAEVERLRAENAALLAANRDCLMHFEDMRDDHNALTHFVADLRAVFSLNECGFTELMNAAIQAQEDAVRYRWMLDHASAEEWREWGKMDAYDDVERAIDDAMRQAAECGNGVGIMK